MNRYRCLASTDGSPSTVPAGRDSALPVTAAELDSGAGAVIQGWPLASYLPSLAALATAPACARGHVRVIAHDWRLSELAETAELLASELVTNAVRASERLKASASRPIVPVVRVWLVSDHKTLGIHVWDGNDQVPVRKDASPDDEGGRGLMLVEALAKDWGAYREAAGKVVWALIGIDPS